MKIIGTMAEGQIEEGVEQPPLVLLLKSPKEDGGPDPYREMLEEFGYRVTFLPVLDFDFVNLEEYSRLLLKMAEFSAIVFTSQQAVKATRLAMTSHAAAEQSTTDKIKCFAVGTSTAEQARSLGFNVEGQDSGNADVLSNKIIADLPVTEKPILYPCGNLKRDVLPTKLKEKGFTVTEVTVYQTSLREDMDERVRCLIQNQGYPDYAVFFSPSGVQSFKSILQLDWFSGDKIKFVAIGPSTERKMEECRFQIYGVCEKPDPKSLVQIMLKSIKKKAD